MDLLDDVVTRLRVRWMRNPKLARPLERYKQSRAWKDLNYELRRLAAIDLIGEELKVRKPSLGFLMRKRY
jgi:hypothetical protein